MCRLSIFELEFSARGPLSLGAVGRRRRRISFSVIRRLALVTAVPAVSYRAIASARRRATCARGCLRRVSTLDFRGIFPRLAWRGWPPPAADFFFGYSATGAGDGGAGCQLPGHRERAAARDLREAIFRKQGDPKPIALTRALLYSESRSNERLRVGNWSVQKLLSIGNGRHSLHQLHHSLLSSFLSTTSTRGRLKMVVRRLKAAHLQRSV